MRETNIGHVMMNQTDGDKLIYIYICIYIYREREKKIEREREIDAERLTNNSGWTRYD